MGKSYKDPFAFTSEDAEQITGLKFSKEELKDWRLRTLIYDVKFKESIIQSNKTLIDHFIGPDNYQSKSVNKRSNPESSKVFLKVV